MNSPHIPARDNGRFFAGVIDRVFFWIRICALGVLLFLTLWRHQEINKAQTAYEILEKHHREVLKELDSVRRQLERQARRINLLEKKQIKPQRHTPHPLPKTEQPKDNRSLFLQKSITRLP